MKEKIIVIDDEQVIREAASEILADSGYAVVTAASGEEGYEKIKEEHFDLVITDVKMPGISGTELIKRIRDELSADVPIVVITAHGTLELAIQSMEYGTQGFILKPFTPGEIRESIDNVLKKARLIKENIKLKTLVPLFEINKRLLSELNLELLWDLIVSEAANYTGSERTSLMLLEDDGSLHLKASCGDYQETDPDKENKERFNEWVVKTKEALLLDSEAVYPDQFKQMMTKTEIRSALCMPILARGKLLGILNLAKVSSDRPFTASDIEIISVLCGQVGIAIENAKLHDNVQNIHLGVIATLANAVEARDEYTANHALRLSTYATFIAKEIGLSRNLIEIIKRAAILHDIGKIGIPDNILLKPSPLTKEEQQIMNEHPVIGSKILCRMNDLEEVTSIVKHHHEYFDGTGYPSRLKADEIPIGARIVAAADAYEAMTSARPYRKAMSFDYATSELEKMSGSQFDPKIVSAFLSVLRRTNV